MDCLRLESYVLVINPPRTRNVRRLRTVAVAAPSALRRELCSDAVDMRYRHARRSVIVAASEFHQNRMAATTTRPTSPSLRPWIRLAQRDDELEAAAWLRARSFYAYPPERKFAGEIHQMMIADEELTALKAARLARTLNANDDAAKEVSSERSACLVALCPVQAIGAAPEQLDERLLLKDDGETQLLLAGTLDVHAVRALPGEILIGSCSNAAYLANVCTAVPARRRGVGEAILAAARELAREWGVEGLYVHTMAVNEIALKFYARNGFVLEQEESSNQAHYRGRCLDGIEGRGRTVLLRDSKL
jgi:GNAT superfamily N-acetyltransferase